LFLGTALVAAGLAVAGVAHAVPLLSIEVFDDGIAVGAGAGPTGGGVLAYDTTDANFSVINVSSTGAPITPDPALGTINLDVQTAAAGTHTLLVEATETNLTGGQAFELANSFTFNALLNPNAFPTSIGSNYVDPGNTPFALTTLIATTGNVDGETDYASPVIDYAPVPSPLFSETEVWTMTITTTAGNPAESQSAAQIVGVVPEPASMALVGSGLVALGWFRRRRT
jgi:hypothetical protein